MSGLDNSQPVTDKASLHEGDLDEAAKKMDDKDKQAAAKQAQDAAKPGSG